MNQNNGRGRDRRDSRRSRSRSPRRDRGNFGGRGGGGGANSQRFDKDRLVSITNVSYETRWLELKTFLREKAGEIKFLEMLEGRDGRPRGTAVVEFETVEGAQNCLSKVNKAEIGGRALVCREVRDPVGFFRSIEKDTGVDFLSRTTHGRAANNTEPDRTPRQGNFDLYGLNLEFLRQLNIDPPLCDRIFVANLPFTAGTDKIYDVFGLAGKITWMDYRIDKEGKAKGACVIQYSHPIEAVQAVSMFHGQKFFDRMLAVRMDKYEKKPEIDIKDGRLPRGLESIGMGLGAGGAPLANVESVFGPNKDTVPPQHQPPPIAPPAPMMTGGYNIDAAAAVLQRALTGAGFGGGMGGGGGAGAGLGGPGQMDMGNKDMKSDYYGNNSGSFGGNGASRNILIKNLPVDYTWQIVRSRIREYGDVESVDMMSPGVARVRFSHIQDAERTRAALVGTSVEGRIIAVDYV